jgi:hypothetical protein
MRQKGGKYGFRRNKHPFDIAEVKNLPKAINEPIAVFKSTKLSDDSKIILTELKDKNGNNFVVIIKLRKDPHNRKINIEANDILSIYPKDIIEEIINWLKSGHKLTLWLDKQKALNFISTQSTLIGGGNKEGLLINIIKTMPFFWGFVEQLGAQTKMAANLSIDGH